MDVLDYLQSFNKDGDHDDVNYDRDIGDHSINNIDVFTSSMTPNFHLSELGRTIEDSVSSRIALLQKKLRIGVPEALVGESDSSSEEEDLENLESNTIDNLNDDESEDSSDSNDDGFMSRFLKSESNSVPQRLLKELTKRFKRNPKTSNNESRPLSFLGKIPFESNEPSHPKSDVILIGRLLTAGNVQEPPTSPLTPPLETRNQTSIPSPTADIFESAFTLVSTSPFHIAASGSGGLINVWVLKNPNNREPILTPAEISAMCDPKSGDTNDMNSPESNSASVYSKNYFPFANNNNNNNPEPKSATEESSSPSAPLTSFGVLPIFCNGSVPSFFLLLHDSLHGLTSLKFSRTIHPLEDMSCCERLVSCGWDRKVALWLVPRSPSTLQPDVETPTEQMGGMSYANKSPIKLLPACVINCARSIPIAACLCAVNTTQLFVAEYTGVLSVYKVHETVASAKKLLRYMVTSSNTLSTSPFDTTDANSMSSNNNNTAGTHSNTALKAAKIRASGRVQRSQYVSALSVSPDGSSLAVGYSDGEVEIYDSQEPTARNLSWLQDISCRNGRGKFAGGRPVSGLSWSDDSKFLVVSCCDNRLRILESDSAGFYVRRKLKGHVHENLLSLKPFFVQGGNRTSARPNAPTSSVLFGGEDGRIQRWAAGESRKGRFTAAGVFLRDAVRNMTHLQNVSGPRGRLSTMAAKGSFLAYDALVEGQLWNMDVPKYDFCSVLSKVLKKIFDETNSTDCILEKRNLFRRMLMSYGAEKDTQENNELHEGSIILTATSHGTLRMYWVDHEDSYDISANLSAVE